MRADRRTDMTNLIVAVRNFSIAPETLEGELVTIKQV
jgi:hypothetical protein